MPKAAVEKSTTTTKRKNASTKRVAAKKTTRKAPTKTPARPLKRTHSSKFIAAAAVAVLIIGGISVAIGTLDKGAINVTATISQRAAVAEATGNEAESEAIRAVNAAPSPTNNVPNGGLVGRGNKETEQQKIEKRNAPSKASSASSTASSTEETASSTDEVVSENSDTPEQNEESVPVETIEEEAEEPASEETAETPAE